jgi:hypothetical protein
MEWKGMVRASSRHFVVAWWCSISHFHRPFIFNSSHRAAYLSYLRHTRSSGIDLSRHMSHPVFSFTSLLTCLFLWTFAWTFDSIYGRNGMELCVLNHWAAGGWGISVKRLFLPRLPYVCEDVALEVALLLFFALRFSIFLLELRCLGFWILHCEEGQTSLASQADL